MVDVPSTAEFLAGPIPEWRGERTLVTESYFTSVVPAKGVYLAGALDAASRRASGTKATLAIGRAWKAAIGLRTRQAEDLILTAECEVSKLSPALARRLRQEISLLRAVCRAFDDECLAALATALARDREAPRPLAVDIAPTICRLGYWKLGDFERFDAVGRRPRSAKATRRQSLQNIFELSIEAAAEFEQLRLASAKRLALDGLALADATSGADSPLAALPAAIVAQVLYEEGYLDDAECMIAGRLSAINAGGTIESAIRAYGVMARIASHRFQIDLALMTLQQSELLGERRGWPRLVAVSIAQKLELFLRHDRVKDAADCAERLALLDGRPVSSDSIVRAEIGRLAILGRCRVALASGASQRDLARLWQLHYEATSGRRSYCGFQVAIWLAEALATAGQSEYAASVLLEAVKIAAGAGLHQAFIDAGPTVGILLRRLYEAERGSGNGRDDTRCFIGSLLDRRTLRDAGRSTRKAIIRSDNRLSEREREILQHIGRGLSNKAVAQALDIMPETVKSHVKHIFAKLAAKNRAQAVSRGEGLGLI